MTARDSTAIRARLSGSLPEKSHRVSHYTPSRVEGTRGVDVFRFSAGAARSENGITRWTKRRRVPTFINTEQLTFLVKERKEERKIEEREREEERGKEKEKKTEPMSAYVGRRDEKAIARPFAAVISLAEVVNKNVPSRFSSRLRLRVLYSCSLRL